MSEHTPGPWFVWPRNPDGGMLHVGPAPHSVAWVRLIDDESANANLIAAAPELLAACEAAIAWWDDGTIPIIEVDKMLHAAIKKAKGL